MFIRRANLKDSDRILELLSQVLEVHAALRPDLFVSGTTKYSKAELAEIIEDDMRPIFVALDENETLMGYAFCVINKPSTSDNMVKFESIYIDDVCVDEAFRCKHVGKALFEYVKSYAKERGFYNITLNVWEGNDSARHFYESMGMGIQSTHMEFIL